MSDSKEYICPLLYGEERLVMVSGDQGATYIPCIPTENYMLPTPSSTIRSQVENGSWVRYITYSMLPHSDAILFRVLLDTGEEVMIPATFLPYLIKAHRKNGIKGGSRGVMSCLRRRY